MKKQKPQEPPVDQDLLVKELHSLAERVKAGDSEAYELATRLIHQAKKQRKKPVPPFDAFEVLRNQGESGLQRALEPLDLAQLRALLLAYGLDSQQLARKWKNKERLRKHIQERLLAHFRSGNVFLQP
jgi:hypothetical protein